MARKENVGLPQPNEVARPDAIKGGTAPDIVKKIKDEKDVEVVKLAARVGAELGADIVKTNYTGDIASFKQVVEGCPVPVIIAGGSKGNDADCLKMIEDAMKAGAAGVAMGRNSFQHENPAKFVKAVCEVVHQGKSSKDACKLLR